MAGTSVAAAPLFAFVEVGDEIWLALETVGAAVALEKNHVSQMSAII